MKKRMLAILVVILLCMTTAAVCTPSVMADSSQTFVFDYAAALSAEEEKELEELAHKIGTDHGVDILFLVFDAGYTLPELRNVTDDFYDNGLYGFEEAHGTGIAMAIDVKSRTYYFSTSGYAEDYFTDSRFADLDDAVLPSLRNSDWAGAGRSYIRFMKRFQNPTVPKTLGMRAQNALEKLPLFGLIGTAISGIFVFFRAKSFSSGKRVSGGYYLMPGSYSLVQADDLFLNEYVTRTRISSDQGRGGGGGFSGGGGGGHHVSSGGFSHGGHGGHF